LHIQALVEDPLFNVEVVTMVPPARIDYGVNVPHIVAAIEGKIRIHHQTHPVTLSAGQFCLIPACIGDLTLQADVSAKLLIARPGKS
jgi:mannose-6-phosphate isomerase class I